MLRTEILKRTSRPKPNNMGLRIIGGRSHRLGTKQLRLQQEDIKLCFLEQSDFAKSTSSKKYKNLYTEV